MAQPVALLVQPPGKKVIQSKKSIERTSTSTPPIAQDEDTVMLVEADNLLGKFEIIPPPLPIPLEMEIDEDCVKTHKEPLAPVGVGMVVP